MILSLGVPILIRKTSVYDTDSIVQARAIVCPAVLYVTHIVNATSDADL